MGTKPINTIKLSDSLTISEYENGFWLYDYTRGMNLSVRAKTKDLAFVEALTYYQKRLKDVEFAMNSLKAKVDDFIGQVTEQNDLE